MRDGERVYKDGMEGTYQLEGKMERERERRVLDTAKRLFCSDVFYFYFYLNFFLLVV